MMTYLPEAYPAAPVYGEVFSKLEDPAYQNELSGLPNRRALNETLAEATVHPDLAHNFGLIFIDLDGVKEVNDSEGHGGGDEYLVNAGTAMRDIAGASDVNALITHLSGDEFVAVVFGVRRQSTLNGLARSLQQSLEEIGVPNSVGPKIHAGETPSELLRAADEQMYRDKVERKLAQLNPQQRSAIIRIMAIAAEHSVSLRDVPAIGEVLLERIVS